MTADAFFKALACIEEARYNLDYTHSFKKSVRLCSKSKFDLNLLLSAVTFLVQNDYDLTLVLLDTGTHSNLF